MFTLLSLVTSVKDYVEIIHKLVETNSSNLFEIPHYYDLGAIFTYLIISGKDLFSSLLTFKWLQTVWSLPLIVPDVASAMISEISVLDGYLHTALTFLDTPLSYGNQNPIFYGLEKFTIGLVNSIFLWLPTSTAYLITLRRFVMQGIEAGYLAGLGTLTGNILWIGSILFGLRFIVIPWLSLDILRYGLGFLLLVKYMWDSYSERRTILEDLSKWKIFLLNFLLAFTEQATVYPFLSNLSVGSDATILESFPTASFPDYTFIHLCYLGGLILGSLTLLHFTCWFWENPAFNLYMWAISSFKLTNTVSQKFVNLCFLYVTMFFAISNVSYFGLDYTLTNPLGLVHEDRLIDQKNLLETAFLNTKASDRNTRRNRGRHGRRERWKRRVRRYRTFDASLYDQGIYDLFTIEDLNYGFDRFWLRRKIRNHRVRFRFFPGPWMRSFKKQLARPRLESFMGPRVEFFRILFEQAYHPEFHEFKELPSLIKTQRVQNVKSELLNSSNLLKNFQKNQRVSFYSEGNIKLPTKNLLKEYSALRKFLRKVNTRTTIAQILSDIQLNDQLKQNTTSLVTQTGTKSLYSKRWKQVFSKISHQVNQPQIITTPQQKVFKTFYENSLLKSAFEKNPSNFINYFNQEASLKSKPSKTFFQSSKQNSEKLLSKKDRQILRYKTFLKQQNENQNKNKGSLTLLQTQPNLYKSLILLHPLKFYLQKEQGFQKKMKFYGTSIFRNFGVENNAPYYHVMMKKFFYYYKPTLRWERTMRKATMRKARRKGQRIPKRFNVNKKTQMLAKNSLNIQSMENFQQNPKTEIQKPTHFYSLVSKRATRYRYQIYKDVLQHWYYTPFNRLFLKFDIDSFIRRQPSSHFFTKKEENLLHLKRFLLADYYNSIRWYTYMQHYESMKTKIGKTKSFASGSYNQQFFGTFKKIRHLFSITPSFNENMVLKFDQPLFNEYETLEKSMNKNFSFYNGAILHEELLADEDLYSNFKSRQTLPQDLINQSTTILKTYLDKTTPIREEYIKNLVKNQNYAELTNFLWKGQKIRGTSPTTNENRFLNQEKNFLLNFNEKAFEKEQLENFFHQKLANERMISSNSFLEKSSNPMDKESLWISLLKKSQNMLYNQDALKVYISGRVDKLEKQKKREQKAFQTRLENIKNWVPSTQNFPKNDFENNNLSGLTSSLQKAIKEGIYYQTDGKFYGTTLQKSNLRNNRPKILQNLPLFPLKTQAKREFKEIQEKANLVDSKNISVNLKAHLKNRVKIRAIQTLETEQKVRETFSSMMKILSKSKTSENETLSPDKFRPTLGYKIIQRTLLPFKFVSSSISRKVKVRINSELGSRVMTPLTSSLKSVFGKKDRTLTTWKLRETVFSARKKIRRKIYRILDQKKSMEKFSNVTELKRLNQSPSNISRQKLDSLNSNELNRRQKSWNSYEKNNLTSVKNSVLKNSKSNEFSNSFSQLFEKEFKRKRTRSRRYRRFKGRGPIKKHTLAEKFKRQFKLLKRYGDNEKGQDKKMEIFQMITKRSYNPESSFETRETKQRRTRQSKHRYWKKHKRQKYLQIKRKQRKRRRYTISKLRVLNKELKRIQSNLQIKKWWWENFLPNFRITTDAYWQTQKDKQIQEEFSQLSVSEILERDERSSGNQRKQTEQSLQIGNQDFKPLAIPQALRLRENLSKNGKLVFSKERDLNQNFVSTNDSITKEIETPATNEVQKKNLPLRSAMPEIAENSETIFSKFSQNLFLRSQVLGLRSRLRLDLSDPNQINKPDFSIDSLNADSTKLFHLNPIPFYAGWDETLRQFVVTNRLLSRKEAGYSMTIQPNRSFNESKPNKLLNSFNSFKTENKSQTIEFSKAPLQGMNAATTLYWQIPFTTYDPDQFFALGMDGFSPLGWRFFNFKHLKETTKPLLVNTVWYNNKDRIEDQSFLSYSLQLKLLDGVLGRGGAPASALVNRNAKNKVQFSEHFSQTNFAKNQARKIQKRQKRIKKHPRPPVWFPSGPLSNQILPVHYIYVFYKRSRLPRDRYIGRRLRRSDDSKSSFIQSNLTKMIDFTLRKRVKPIRKYHRKRPSNKNQETGLILRRRPFKDLESENLRFRPIVKSRLTTQTDILNASLLKSKQRKKPSQNKQTSENLRIRQLRRRVQRQVLRPIWRYKPRSGGFVWPGDYLRLENTKAPVLKSSTNHSLFSNTKTVTDPSKGNFRKKKRQNIQEWQIQPKKYLVQKHNLKVLKKRLEKSQN